MKVKQQLEQIKKFGDDELKEHLKKLLKERFELRMQYKGGQLNDISKIAKSRKEIARVKTLLNQNLATKG